MDAEILIDYYSLSPHPEGGHYVRTYCDAKHIDGTALTAEFSGDRAFSSAILFLLKQGEKSHLHRLTQDEGWHFYLGGPLKLFTLSPAGQLATVVLGQDVLRGQKLQHVVPAGHWFAAEPLEQSPYALVGCTVAPAFCPEDFELADSDQLMKQYPAHADFIQTYSHPKEAPIDPFVTYP